MPPPTPAHQKSTPQSLAYIPMWDSSDPRRNPAPLPPNPKPGSPRATTLDSAPSSREVSPIRRTDTSSNSLQSSPARSTPILLHKRANSSQPSPSVREMQNLIMSGGHTSPTRNGSPATPTPRELFGSNTTFPSRSREHRDSFSKEYSSVDYRKSLDFDKAPSLPPLSRNLTSPEAGASTSPPHSNHALIMARSPDFEHTPTKLPASDFSTLSSQLSGLTAIASNLQREMSNLSRRSKDNATDLISLKEATKNRDEDIRRSLREMAQNLGPGEASHKLLEQARSPLTLTASRSASSGSSSYASDAGDLLESGKIPLLRGARLEPSVLEKIVQEMPSREDQERIIEILNDIKDTLKPGVGKSEVEEQILSILEDIKEREEARGMELVISGTSAERETLDQTNERIISSLQELREGMLQEKDSEQKIISLLEELKGKENAMRGEDRIVEVLEELKEREGDERLQTIIPILEELRAREGVERLVSMLEDVQQGIKNMFQYVQSKNTIPSTFTEDLKSQAVVPDLSAIMIQILDTLNDVKGNTENKLEYQKDVKRFLDDLKVQWTGRDKEIGEALKDLFNQLEILATEQRNATARLPYLTSPSHHSQALTTTNPPLPPDLDNEAAITALANIASTTTRTDITLSSINALIKVFQKETQSVNNNNAENLTGMNHYLDELNHSLSSNSANYHDIRKVLEVVRTGVCSGNDRLAAFEDASVTKTEELLYLQKQLHKLMLGGGEEVLWKRDVGVKDEVEELRDRLEEVAQRNYDAVNQIWEKTFQAVSLSNPAENIAELKLELGAMAQRSLEAFQKADSRASIQKLQGFVEESLAKLTKLIGGIDNSAAIVRLRDELMGLLRDSMSVVQRIDARDKSTIVEEALSGIRHEIAGHMEASAALITGEVAEVKAAIDASKIDFAKLIEESLTTAVAAASADDKTAAALAELRTGLMSQTVALSEKPNEFERVLEPLGHLREEIREMMEKSVSDLSLPQAFPEAVEIKACLETLATELTESVQKANTLVAESAASTAGTGAEVKAFFEELQKDIAEMGASLTAAMSDNSISAFEEGMKADFISMKLEVLRKIEQGLQFSDRAVSATAEVSEHLKGAIEELKQEVKDSKATNMSTAIAPIGMERPETAFQESFHFFKKEISDIIQQFLASNGNNDETKALIKQLREEVSEMMQKRASVVAIPAVAPNFDQALQELLESIKIHITDSVGGISVGPPKSTSGETKASVDELCSDMREMMRQTNSMIAPLPLETKISVHPLAGYTHELEQLLGNLKSDVNEMFEKSLAAAIANSTFDSEENVKEALDDLKREVKDTLEKSMMPAPQQKDDTPTIIREAISILRQDISTMLDKKSAGEEEDREEVRRKLEGLKAQFGELLEKSSSVEVKEAVEGLGIQLEELPERMLNVELKALLETMKQELREKPAGLDIREAIEMLKSEIQNPKGLLPENTVKELVDKLTDKVESLAEKSIQCDIKNSLDSLKAQIDGLADKSADSGVKESLLALTALIEVLAEKSKDDELQDSIESLRMEIQAMVEKSTIAFGTTSPQSTANIELLIKDFKKDVLDAVGEGTEAIRRFATAEAHEQLKSEVRNVNKYLGLSPLEIKSPDERGLERVTDAVEGLKKEVRELADRAGGTITVLSAGSEEPVASTIIPDMTEVKDAIADAGSAIGEARVEIAVLNALVEEKSSEAKEFIDNVALNVKDCQQTTNSGISTANRAIETFRTEAKEAAAGFSTSISTFQKDMGDGILNIKGSIGSMREEAREGLEEVNKTVEGAQVELKEVISAVEAKFEQGHAEIREIASTVGVSIDQARNQVNEDVSRLAATVAISQTELMENFVSIQRRLEDSCTNNLSGNRKTQSNVLDVLSRVDDLQTEWKGHQPTLFNALLEMKLLLLEVQKNAAQKPDLEALIPPPPPTYDDSQAQEKLDIIIAGNTTFTKYLPQLNLLDSIQQQMVATSANISEFLNMQTTVIKDDAASKANAAHKAELDLEEARSKNRTLEAATDSLRSEHDKLQATVETLYEETEDLRSTKLKLSEDLAGLETALRLRREELTMLEARGEALERRMLEGIIDQSRALFMKPSIGSTHRSKATTDTNFRKLRKRPAGTTESRHTNAPVTSGRRHLSLNQITSDGIYSKSGRTSLNGTGTLGLGQKEYSASLGLLGRSQSVKQRSYTDGSSGHSSSLDRKIKQVSSGGLKAAHESVVTEDGAGQDSYIDIFIEEEAVIIADDEDEGSIIRPSPNEDGDGNAEEILKHRSKKYPALGLDFSRRESSASADTRSASDISNVT